MTTKKLRDPETEIANVVNQITKARAKLVALRRRLPVIEIAKDGGSKPGASFFQKRQDGTIVRTSKTRFGPGDDFCALWHLFDLLPRGRADWQPKLKY